MDFLTTTFLLRFCVGALLVAFSYGLGAALGRQRWQAEARAGFFRWTLRVVVAALAMTWRAGVDVLAIAAFGVACCACAVGAWRNRRPPQAPQEDLSKVIFPSE